MKLTELTKELRAGKKVARKYWTNGSFITRTGNQILGKDGNPYNLTFFDVDSSDWVLVEDKQETLSDKILKDRLDELVIPVFDVKEFIKQLKYWINNENGDGKYFMSLGIDKLNKKIDELSGDK